MISKLSFGFFFSGDFVSGDISVLPLNGKMVFVVLKIMLFNFSLRRYVYVCLRLHKVPEENTKSW